MLKRTFTSASIKEGAPALRNVIWDDDGIGRMGFYETESLQTDAAF